MNKQIFVFLSDLEGVDPKKSDIAKTLYEIFTADKKITEKFIYGGIGMYLGDKLIGGIYSSKKHISLVFSLGNELEDKYHVLEGEGQFRRHIKLSSLEEIDSKKCRYYIEQVIALESSFVKN